MGEQRGQSEKGLWSTVVKGWGAVGRSVGQMSGRSPVCLCQPYTFLTEETLKILQKVTVLQLALGHLSLPFSPLLILTQNFLD